VGFLSGEATVENLKMTQSALKTIFNAPLSVTNGKLGKLTLKIPWTDLANKPTIMKLEGLSVIAEVTDSIEYSEEDEIKYKQYLLDTIEKSREAKAIAQQATQKSSSQNEAYMDRILRNLQVYISSITFDISDSKLGTRFGFHLSSLVLQSCDQNWTIQGKECHLKTFRSQYSRWQR